MAPTLAPAMDKLIEVFTWLRMDLLWVLVFPDGLVGYRMAVFLEAAFKFSYSNI